MAEATDALVKAFGAGLISRPVLPPAPDAWDEIVGIPLDMWMRADAPEQIEWLAWLRDHPLPTPAPPTCACPRVEILTYEGGPVRTVPGRRDADCEAHGHG